MAFLSAPDTSANLLPTTGHFALKNIGTRKTVGVSDSGRYLKSGPCVEFQYQLDPDEVWGVLKPKGSAKVWDFWEVSFGKGFFGLWTKYNPPRNHQRFRMEGKYLLSRAKKYKIALKT